MADLTDFQRDTKLPKLPKSIKSLLIKFALNDSYNIYCLRNSEVQCL